MTWRLAIKFPTPYECWSNFLPPGQEKTSNARGMPGGRMLKLRFEWYIIIVSPFFENFPCSAYIKLNEFIFIFIHAPITKHPRYITCKKFRTFNFRRKILDTALKHALSKFTTKKHEFDWNKICEKGFTAGSTIKEANIFLSRLKKAA